MRFLKNKIKRLQERAGVDLHCEVENLQPEVHKTIKRNSTASVLKYSQKQKGFLVYSVEHIRKAFQRVIFQYIDSQEGELLIQEVTANYNLVALETKTFFMNNQNNFERFLIFNELDSQYLANVKAVFQKVVSTYLQEYSSKWILQKPEQLQTSLLQYRRRLILMLHSAAMAAAINN